MYIQIECPGAETSREECPNNSHNYHGDIALY